MAGHHDRAGGLLGHPRRGHCPRRLRPDRLAQLTQARPSDQLVTRLVLAMLAHAFLSVMTATQPGRPRPASDQLHWSRWRRRHQATARNCHHQHCQALAVT